MPAVQDGNTEIEMGFGRYIYVTETTWNYRAITYFTALQSLALTIFGIVGGIIMWGTKRFKVGANRYFPESY